MKKIVISSVVLFVVSMALGFLIHGMLLRGDYESSGLMRPDDEQQRMFGLMVLAHVLIAVGFTLIYRKGREAKAWLGQGVRFGLLWALASLIPTYLIYLVVMPFETGLVIKQVLFDTPAVVILGVVAAFVNRE